MAPLYRYDVQVLPVAAQPDPQQMASVPQPVPEMQPTSVVPGEGHTLGTGAWLMAV